MSLIIRLAFRNIFRNVRRTVLTVLMIASGVAAMMVVDGLMVGMEDLMVRQVTGTFIGDAQIHREGFRDTFDLAFYIEDTSEIVDVLNSDPGVSVYGMRVLSGGMISSSNNIATGLVYAVEPEKEAQIGRLKEALVDGEYLTGQSSTEIMIGQKMAELLEVRLGDRIVATVADANSGELSQGLFRVSGFLQFNDRTMDKEMAFISLAQGQELLGIAGGAHEIAIRFDDTMPEAETLERLQGKIASDEIEILGWQGLMPDLANMLEVQDISLWIVGGILFVLVSLGVINSMFMSVYERHYEFGVMLSLGTRSQGLFNLICWEGFLIGVFGCIAGIVLGGVLSYWLSIQGISFSNAEFAGLTINEPIKTILRPLQFTIIPMFVVVLTTIACIIPALHGARLTPSKAMRRAL